MAANNFYFMKLIVPALTIMFGVACNAGVKEAPDKAQNKVLELVSEKILQAVVAYENRAGYCTDLMESNMAPKLDANKLTSLKATREDAVIALSYMRFNNFFICERDARLELAFHLGTMQTLKREMSLDSRSVEEIQDFIAYPSSRELGVEIEYLKLSQAHRRYFESTIGDKPFDLMKALQVNQLFRD